MEAVEAGRALVAVARRHQGRGAARLAHRVLGDGLEHLGETFDIHGGGIDLVFPHHENELAQTCCAFHAERMAQVWMHNGFLQVESEKMSKSLGNFVTIRELLETDTFGGRKWPGDVLRLAMLRTHYRSPIDWTLAALEESEQALENWIDLLERHGTSFGQPMPNRSQVVEALADDLNTSQAIAELHRLAGLAKAGDAARRRPFTRRWSSWACSHRRRSRLARSRNSVRLPLV